MNNSARLTLASLDAIGHKYVVTLFPELELGEDGEWDRCT